MMLDTKVEGLQEIDKVLKNLGPRLAQREIDLAVAAGARVIRDEIKNQAPEFRGVLRQEIRVTKRRKRRFSSEFAVHTGKAYWARFIEFGTSRMSPRPFFTRGFDASKNRALQKMVERLANRLPKVAAQIAGDFNSISKVVRRRL